MDNPDKDLTINQIMFWSHQTAKNKGFRNLAEPRPITEDILLMHSELSEALEAYRSSEGIEWLHALEECESGEKPEGVFVELADTLIRICETCYHYEIDFEKVIRLKMAYNRTRELKHGGKKI